MSFATNNAIAIRKLGTILKHTLKMVDFQIDPVPRGLRPHPLPPGEGSNPIPLAISRSSTR